VASHPSMGPQSLKDNKVVGLQVDVMRLGRGETVPGKLLHRLASLQPSVLGGDHLRRPHGAHAFLRPGSHRGSSTARLRWAQIITRALNGVRCGSRRTSAYNILIHQRCSSGPYF
jgi:hypothetical protein